MSAEADVGIQLAHAAHMGVGSNDYKSRESGMGLGVARAMKRFPKGSYPLIPAGAPHYEATKKTTVVISTATGPWVTTQEST